MSGRQLFASAGVKLPRQAAKARSGTRTEIQHEAKKLDRAGRRMLARQRQEDLPHTCEPSVRTREARQVERLKQAAAKIRTWLQAHPADRKGVRGGLRKSNRTDNDWAKRAPGKGVIQGATGGAVVDEKHPIIVSAPAHGVGQEQALLVPSVAAVPSLRAEATALTADAGDQSADNLRQLAAQGIAAYLPDHGYRKRDPRSLGQGKPRCKPAPLYTKGSQSSTPRLCRPQDVHPAEERSHGVCPAGARRHRNGRHRALRGGGER